LCITKGQEVKVYGWHSTKGSHGQLILDTLFVELTNPPRSIMFEGLSENVVPLTCTTNTIVCLLPDDTTVQISWSQIDVLLNFALTDFAAQGKS
jgi:hypothetical protein